MDQRLHYRRLYRRLQLPEDADATRLRRHWQRLAARLHPDRHPDNPRATAEFQELQAAHDALRAFYQRHGHLPLEHTQARVISPPSDTRQGAEPRPQPTRALSGWLRRGLAGAAILLAMAVALLLLPPTPPQPATDETSQAAAVPEPHRSPRLLPPRARTKTGSHRRIRPGMSMGDLLEVAGIPDQTTPDAWYYGRSVVWLRDGRVSGWRNDSTSPIPTDPQLPLVLNP